MNSANSLTGWQQFLLVLFRFCVGWHLFYQGMGKLQAPQWSAESYVKSATGPLASLFQTMAENRAWLSFADQATIWGLMALGVLVMVGLFTRSASLGAIALLLLFYLAHPPFPVHGFGVPTINGNELYVNQVLIEILALTVNLAFNTGKISGIDMLVHEWIRRKNAAPAATMPLKDL